MVLTFFLKWNVDTCLPHVESQIFPGWLAPPNTACQVVRTWDLNAQSYSVWKQSQVGMFNSADNQGLLFSVYHGVRTLIERLIYPTIVMSSFPKEIAISLTYLGALLIVSFVMAIVIEWLTEIVISWNVSTVGRDPVPEGRKKRRLTATMILLKSNPGGANSLVIRNGPHKSDETEE